VEVPEPLPTASTAPSNTQPAQSNANPRATAKSANATVRPTPHATTRTKNPQATAGEANGRSSSGQTSAPPDTTN
jgi:hypothetical protein